MNGSPSVKVALNPRADGSMSPKYTSTVYEESWRVCYSPAFNYTL